MSLDSVKPNSVELLQAHALVFGDKPAFRFISGHANRGELSLTYLRSAQAPAAIPKTSSRKTRRSVCRERYLSGQLPAIAHWKANGEIAAEETNSSVIAPRRPLPAPRSKTS